MQSRGAARERPAGRRGLADRRLGSTQQLADRDPRPQFFQDAVKNVALNSNQIAVDWVAAAHPHWLHALRTIALPRCLKFVLDPVAVLQRAVARSTQRPRALWPRNPVVVD